MSQHEANWDLDSVEIASIASEELHENRPNRWRGPKATWRYVTEEERMLWRSMKQLQDEDLGVHLYNAFALKKRATNPESAKDLAIKTVFSFLDSLDFLYPHTKLLAGGWTGGWTGGCLGAAKDVDGLAHAAEAYTARWPIQRRR